MKANLITPAVFWITISIGSTLHAEGPWHPFEPGFHYVRVETMPADSSEETDQRSYALTVRSKIKFRGLGLSDGTFAWMDIDCSNRASASDPHQCNVVVTEPGMRAPLKVKLSLAPGERVVAGKLEKADGKAFQIAVTAANETSPPFNLSRPASDSSTHVLFLRALRVADGRAQPVALDMYEIHRSAHIGRLASFGGTELRANISCIDRHSRGEAHQCNFEIASSGGQPLRTAATLAPGVDVDLGEVALPDGSRIQVQARASPVPAHRSAAETP